MCWITVSITAVNLVYNLRLKVEAYYQKTHVTYPIFYKNFKSAQIELVLSL